MSPVVALTACRRSRDAHQSVATPAHTRLGGRAWRSSQWFRRALCCEPTQEKRAATTTAPEAHAFFRTPPTPLTPLPPPFLPNTLTVQEGGARRHPRRRRGGQGRVDVGGRHPAADGGAGAEAVRRLGGTGDDTHARRGRRACPRPTTQARALWSSAAAWTCIAGRRRGRGLRDKTPTKREPPSLFLPRTPPLDHPHHTHTHTPTHKQNAHTTHRSSPPRARSSPRARAPP